MTHSIYVLNPESGSFPRMHLIQWSRKTITQTPAKILTVFPYVRKFKQNLKKNTNIIQDISTVQKSSTVIQKLINKTANWTQSRTHRSELPANRWDKDIKH